MNSDQLMKQELIKAENWLICSSQEYPAYLDEDEELCYNRMKSSAVIVNDFYSR